MVKGYVVFYKTLQKQKNGDEEDKKPNTIWERIGAILNVSLKQEKI